MKNIFITGVSTGIGYDALTSLVSRGYFVIGTVRKSEDSDKLKKEFGDKCIILIFDVRDVDKCTAEIKKVIPKLEKEGLFCLINNAGIAIPGPLQHITEDEFEQQMDVNVKSVRRITNMLLPYLGTDKKYEPGKIINISSVSGLFNSPYNGSYCISKHALESMTDVYRRELAMFGIRVSAIQPGPIKTEIWNKSKGTLDRFKDTAYGELLSSADKMIENAEKSAFDVKVVTDIIINILQSKQPKTKYLIHRKKFLFRLLAFYLPDKLVDKMIAKTLAKKDNYRPV
ncbi:MAG: SDR family NAD(P)-dependent oxidoreductase [Saprospiraceae bacterium]|jgi:NAD(P)-dependent dehydrogenase (short-subunit alcohol dehydrogenase family)|nr:SDR family NAD(P)-dependent oxidoreductase [Saprospiraceae bacterium]MBP6566345.1 SDR family NAD(P)-dependent oxidoreductase [Saprospiraceae bacterium]